MFVAVAPFAGSIAFVHFATQWVSPPTRSLWLFLGWWFGLSLSATFVLFLTDRVSRRLLPLAALLKLSLIFPDETPSRLKTALRSGGVNSLEKRLVLMREAKEAGSARESVERLLELVASLNAHDRLTRGHSERVRAYSVMIGKELSLDREEVDLLNWAALLHDVGKLEVDQVILMKPGKLTAEEWQVLRKHPLFGEQLVAPMREWLGEWAEAVGYHHERWDGKGYPRGITSLDIPLAARIVAVADVFDVITSARSYKHASSSTDARQEIARCAGSQFDPRVVRAFLNVSLGRMRMVMGPLSWLSHAPLLGRLPFTPAVGTLAGALSVVATSVAAGIVSQPGIPKIREVRAQLVAARLAAPAVPELRHRGAAAAPPVARGQVAARETPSHEVVRGAQPKPVAAVAEPVRVVPKSPTLPDTTENAPVGAPQEQPAEAAPYEPAPSSVTVPVPIATTPAMPPVAQTPAPAGPPPAPAPPSAQPAVATPAAAGSRVVEPAAAQFVNQPPSFSAGPDQAVLEDSGVQTVESWVAAVSPGPADESTQTVTFAVSTTSPGLFSAQPAVSPNGTLTYRPAPNANGTGTVTVRAVDSGGIANRGDDTSPARVFTITVVAVNDPPSFSAGPDQAVLEDSGVQTVESWVAAVSPGPADESTQTVTFAVSTTSPGLFSTQPAVSPNGTLTYRPAPNANGTGTVTVRAVDSGGIANGGDDISVEQIFTVTVTPVNDPPSFSTGPNQIAPEDGGAQTVTTWATAVSPGPGNESGQTVAFVVSSDNPTLFDPAGPPSVGTDGTLAYTPGTNQHGIAVVSVSAVDNGGATNGGNDTSPTQMFTITVQPTLPVAGDDAYSTTLNQPLAVNAPGVLGNDADVNGSPLTVRITPVSVPSNGTLTISNDGSFTYTPNLAFVGTDSFVYQIDNSLGLTSTGTATITVSTSLFAPAALYLQTSGPSADIWTMDTTSPPNASPVPDYDGDGKEGLTIDAGDGKETTNDPRNQQYWTYTLPAPVILNGPVTLDLYSALQNFDSDKRVEAIIFLYDCDNTGTTCTKIAQNDILITNWNPASNWGHQQLTVGSVSSTLLTGHQLRIRLLVKRERIWIAMTAAFPSALVLSLGP